MTTDAGTIKAETAAKYFKKKRLFPGPRGATSQPGLLGGPSICTPPGRQCPRAAEPGWVPEEALRLARGEEIVWGTGQPVEASRPLDWLAIADHSDGLGVVNEVIAGNPKFMADPTAKRWNQQMNAGSQEAMKAVMEMITLQGQGKLPAVITDPELFYDLAKETAIVEKYNEPGRFTAFIAYEWTSNYGGGNNLHRNVIYRDGKDKADRVAPMTTFESENPEDLWKWLQAYEEKTGGRLLAIPHNGNLSNGLMFALETLKGDPLTKEWAASRAR